MTPAVPSGRSVSGRPLRSVEAVHLLAHDVRALARGARRRRRCPRTSASRPGRSRPPRTRRGPRPARRGGARPAAPYQSSVPRGAWNSWLMPAAARGTGLRSRSLAERRRPGRARAARSSRAGRRASASRCSRRGVAMSPPAKSVRPTEPAKRTSPDEQVAVGVVGDRRRRVAGHGRDGEVDAGDRHRLAAARAGGRARAARAGARAAGRPRPAGIHTSTPASRATAATPPRWSKWPCVTSTPAAVQPRSARWSATSSGVSPGSMTAASAPPSPGHEIAVGLIGAERELDDVEAGRPVHAAGPPCFFCCRRQTKFSTIHPIDQKRTNITRRVGQLDRGAHALRREGDDEVEQRREEDRPLRRAPGRRSHRRAALAAPRAACLRSGFRSSCSASSPSRCRACATARWYFRRCCLRVAMPSVYRARGAKRPRASPHLQQHATARDAEVTNHRRRVTASHESAPVRANPRGGV